jgi:hypothetical protein
MLLLAARVDCPECEQSYDEVWQAPDGADTVEDLVEAPVQDSVCPGCGHIQHGLAWPGFSFFSEAG